MTDLGIGIQRNVSEFLGYDISPTDAIAWATVDKHTTKTGRLPGGLGLSLLMSFIDLNGGHIQIVSDTGYLKRKNGKTSKGAIARPFPGTVINLEINTADTNSYVLAEEVDPADIW